MKFPKVEVRHGFGTLTHWKEEVEWSDIINLDSYGGFFLHIFLSGPHAPPIHPQQLPFRSSLQWELSWEFPYHSCCAKVLSRVLHLCHGPELKQVAVHQTRIRFSFLHAAKLYQKLF